MSRTVTLNRKQRLYVIPLKMGYSCLGWDVCQRRAEALALELGEAKPPGLEPGTLEYYAWWESLLHKGCQRHARTGWKSQIELTPELRGYEGRRVEVRHKWGDGQELCTRFQVGRSTGWMPVHLQLARRNCLGGPAVCLGTILHVRIIS